MFCELVFRGRRTVGGTLADASTRACSRLKADE